MTRVSAPGSAGPDGPPLLYFDHAATAPRRPEVLEAMAPYLSGTVGNPSGSHRAAREARLALDDAREEVAELTGSAPGAVVFTGGGTESCNLAVFGVAADRARRGCRARLVVSAIEHHAVLDAAARLERELLLVPADVVRLPVTAEGVVDLEAAATLCAEADLVSVMTANNEVGTVQPIPELGQLLGEVAPRAVFHSDAVAAAPWFDLGVEAAGADLLTICAHKLGGPVGIGALCFRREIALVPLIVGGGQERGRRAGTPDVAAAVGLAVALRLSSKERVDAATSTASRRGRLSELLVAGADGVHVTAPHAPKLPGTCHVTIEGISSEELVFLCDQAGLCVSAASSCASGAATASHVLEAMGTDATPRASLRLSIGADTTDEEITLAARIVVDAVARLQAARA